MTFSSIFFTLPLRAGITPYINRPQRRPCPAGKGRGQAGKTTKAGREKCQRQEQKFILSLKIIILSLRIIIFNPKIIIANAKINFSRWQTLFFAGKGMPLPPAAKHSAQVWHKYLTNARGQGKSGIHHRKPHFSPHPLILSPSR